MSPIITNVSAINPPAPKPCSALVKINCVMFWEAPAKNDPIRKVMIAN